AARHVAALDHFEQSTTLTLAGDDDAAVLVAFFQRGERGEAEAAFALVVMAVAAFGRHHRQHLLHEADLAAGGRGRRGRGRLRWPMTSLTGTATVRQAPNRNSQTRPKRTPDKPCGCAYEEPQAKGCLENGRPLPSLVPRGSSAQPGLL